MKKKSGFVGVEAQRSLNLKIFSVPSLIKKGFETRENTEDSREDHEWIWWRRDH